MTIAWVTHHLPVEDTGGGKWLPGQYRGGAEMSDAAYRDCAPPWAEIDLIPANEWERALTADRIVITGTDLLTEDAMIRLADENPMVFLHHEQTESPGRNVLLDAAAPMVVHTPAHRDRELAWCEPRSVELVLSHFDTSEIREIEKRHFALWAARNHPLKGLKQAKVWAYNFGIDLLAVSDLARPEVLELMASAEWFVHLPLNFESEGRAVMEAVLAGCQIHTSPNVGITSVENWEDRNHLRELIDNAGTQFWECVYQ